LEVGTIISKLDARVVDFGPLEINCFSICFWVDIEGSNYQDSLYIKIPKVIFYDQSKAHLGYFSEKDKDLAIAEYDSLTYLADHWDDSFGVKFVETLGYISKYNAIITRRIKAEFLFRQFRKSDSLGVAQNLDFDPVLEAIEKIGASLKSLHLKQFQSTSFNCNDLNSKFGGYIDSLKEFGVRPRALKNIQAYLLSYDGFTCQSNKVNNFKGLDIRQIFNVDQQLTIIDPGKRTIDFAEANLARFIVTCRILYWGSYPVLLGRCPSVKYENAFLEEYEFSKNGSEKMLNLFIMKEILKHWKMAHMSLDKRNWGRTVKLFLKKIYIDRFYTKLLKNEIIRVS
jgi:hypothetical protein